MPNIPYEPIDSVEVSINIEELPEDTVEEFRDINSY